MTCIVGLAEGEKVYIGCDSLGINEDGRARINTYRKVFRVGDMLIGYSGSIRMGQLLQYSFTPPAYYHEHMELGRYIAKDFVKAIQELFEAEKLKEDDRGQILVGFRGHLFDIDGQNYQVEEEVGGYIAIGSGTDLALGALHALGNDYPPESRIETALSAAADHNATVKGPFYIESI